MDAFDRVKLLIGDNNYQKLQRSHVAVFGIGGVGGMAVEALARSGVGEITIVDNDTVASSNLNRQIVATTANLNSQKTLAMKERLLSINPKLKINVYNVFYLPETEGEIDFSSFNYVVDAVDTVTAKILIIENAYKKGIPVITCMGTGGKIDISKLCVSKIEKTTVCPLARVMRRELKARGISGIKAVFSLEESKIEEKRFSENGKLTQPSMMFVPAGAGLMIACEVVKDLTEN